MPKYDTCRNCGEPATGSYSLPVDDNGDIVGVSYTSSWSGVPSCENCNKIHASVRLELLPLTETQIVRAVLKAYEKATESLCIALENMRERMAKIDQLTTESVIIADDELESRGRR